MEFQVLGKYIGILRRYLALLGHKIRHFKQQRYLLIIHNLDLIFFTKNGNIFSLGI
jgi:hypothetical protein